MPDEGDHLAEVHTGSEGSAGKWILLLLAVIYVAGSLYFLFNLRERVDQMGKGQAASNAQIAELDKRMQSAEADSEAIATQVGMTKKELAARSAEFACSPEGPHSPADLDPIPARAILVQQKDRLARCVGSRRRKAAQLVAGFAALDFPRGRSCGGRRGGGGDFLSATATGAEQPPCPGAEHH